ncbi:Thyrostimulin beta-5 subunit [Amphibalanus amphitrite]|uniref:Thyrostimulin beta-5 subunit n=1 Tax=Amphibalanus amphitrite TaxID=1232801 RepID=A0A6A4XAF0_AMPAM|nr:Thyrostimulin beta-5 subunit [Amphibalanus amphitrite]
MATGPRCRDHRRALPLPPPPPLLLLLAGMALLVAAARPVAGRTPLLTDLASDATPCQPRPDFSFSVMQRDGAGRACWDQIQVMTCWGHCRSHEVPDWRFPYKRSHHPVCIHDRNATRSVTLTHCDPGVAEGTADYQYVDAVSCKCAVCDSSRASCEGAKFRSTRSWRPAS